MIEAPLGGNIFKTIASEGDSVDADTTVLILEAMKMETEIKAPSAGVIGKYLSSQEILLNQAILYLKLEANESRFNFLKFRFL